MCWTILARSLVDSDISNKLQMNLQISPRRLDDIYSSQFCVLFIFIYCVRNAKNQTKTNQIFILNICSVVECHDLCISNEQLLETIIFLNTEQSFSCKDRSIYAPKKRNFLLFLPASAAMLLVAHLVVCFWVFKHEGKNRRV